jgi:glycerophosphoryl diester phosphodiesterase
MLQIFGHRAIFNGIENSVESISYYKKLGIGIELDLRSNYDNQVYVSHDATNKGDFFEEICKKCEKSEIKMALHIKESKTIPAVINILKKFSLKNYFLFDTENFEYDKSADNIKIAEYISQKTKNFKRNILWCDEIQTKWYSKEIIKNLHQKNKLIYVMSLEVVQKCDEKEIILEWKRLIDLGVDGICTKYPEKLIKFVKGDLN